VIWLHEEGLPCSFFSAGIFRTRYDRTSLQVMANNRNCKRGSRFLQGSGQRGNNTITQFAGIVIISGRAIKAVNTAQNRIEQVRAVVMRSHAVTEQYKYNRVVARPRQHVAESGVKLAVDMRDWITSKPF